MEIQAKDNAVDGSQVALSEQVQELIRRGSLDFATWTSLISKIEKLFSDNIEGICSVYDSFLLEFPLCHEYWAKYVAHMARLCSLDKLVDIYELAVKSAPYCVSIWVEYCSFGMLAYEDPSDVRRLFKRALSSVGKDYMCYPLWDKYFEFEYSQQQWTFVAQIYVQALKFPTKKLHHYYDNFKKFVDILEEEMKFHAESEDIEVETIPDGAISFKDEISSLIDNLLHPSTGYFRKYISIGEKYYWDASELEKKIHQFEKNIHRHNYDATPVDDDQLENWRQYLDFVEKQGDFDWAMKLYERCLIPCSGYPEFWMRYIDYMESKGGRELAKFALDHAKKIFVKNSPEIHIFDAQFQELIGDTKEALTTFVWSESSLDFVEKVVREANCEKRLGNFHRASTMYETSLKIAEERKKLHEVSVLYVHYARLIYSMTGRRDHARNVLTQGLWYLPYCKILLEGLINFLMMHGDKEQIDVVDKIVANAIIRRSDSSQGLSDEDRQDISTLYLQFVDLCGTIHDIRKAWSRHLRLFPRVIRSSTSDKLHKTDNELMELMEPRLLHPEDHALISDYKISTADHTQHEEDNENKKENLVEEDTYQLNEIVRDSVHELTEDLEQGVADDDEQGKKCLSFEGLSLKDHEMDSGDLVTQQKRSNANVSPQIVRQESSQDAVLYQPQNEQSNYSSLVNHENDVSEPAEMDTHVAIAQGSNQDNSVASQSVNQPQQNTIPVLLSQPSTGPAFHQQAYLPQFQMPSGGTMGYNQTPSGILGYYGQLYNNSMGYYQQSQQMITQQMHQRLMLQNQQYMQQVQQQWNMHQAHGQQGLNYQQQQQLTQPQYQQLYQQLYQQPDQQITSGHTPTWNYYQQGLQAMSHQVNPSSTGTAESPQPPKHSP